MTALIVVSLTLVALAGTTVVAADAPERQAVTLSFFGLTLTALFLVFQAPDVALSQVAVGAAVVPLMVLLAIRTMRADRAKHKGEHRGRGGEGRSWRGPAALTALPGGRRPQDEDGT